MTHATKFKLKWAGILVLLVLVLIVIFQNTGTAPTHLLFVTISMPRIVLLFVTLMIGIITGALGMRYIQRNWRSKN
jgi:uncharacterized integral membrane protein